MIGGSIYHGWLSNMLRDNHQEASITKHQALETALRHQCSWHMYTTGARKTPAPFTGRAEKGRTIAITAHCKRCELVHRVWQSVTGSATYNMFTCLLANQKMGGLHSKDGVSTPTTDVYSSGSPFSTCRNDMFQDWNHPTTLLSTTATINGRQLWQQTPGCATSQQISVVETHLASGVCQGSGNICRPTTRKLCISIQ